jgi:hypothetical protein
LHRVVISQKIEFLGSRCWPVLSERKGGFVEHNMSRDDDTICGKIEAPIPLMVVRVAEECT